MTTYYHQPDGPFVKIIILDEGKEWQTTIEHFPFKIGRDPAENVICLHDHTVSRKHAEVSLKNDKLFITDLGSKNGTTVNGRRINTSTYI